MRRAHQDADFITAGEEVIGVKFGYDHCAEHEWGIRRIRDAFGLERRLLGYEGFKNTRVPSGLMFRTEPDPMLVFEPHPICMDASRYLKNLAPHELALYDADLATAWSEEDFGIRAQKQYRSALENLFDALQTNNGAIFLSNSENPFANNGLVLLDYRKIDEDVKEEAREADRMARRTSRQYRRLERKSGVYERLSAAGKEYFYLGIERLDEEGRPLWWLNPQRQRQNNYGWYHTEDLLAWAQDEGPIPKR